MFSLPLVNTEKIMDSISYPQTRGYKDNYSCTYSRVGLENFFLTIPLYLLWKYNLKYLKGRTDTKKPKQRERSEVSLRNER